MTFTRYLKVSVLNASKFKRGECEQIDLSKCDTNLSASMLNSFKYLLAFILHVNLLQ